MEELADNGVEYADKVFISCSACYDDAKTLADLIEARFPNLREHVVINSIGTTIGSHTGPGTVALFFWGQKRE
jgi:fatty acid-binding protein DegV